MPKDTNTDPDLKPVSDPALTPTDIRLREIYALAGSEDKEFPVVSDVRQLFRINELDVPYYNKVTKMGIRHPDYAYEYKWVDKNDVSQLVGSATSAIWKPVNKTNHPHIKGQGYVHPVYGTVIYKDSVILCFTRREYKEQMQKALVEDYIRPSKPNEYKDHSGGKENFVAIGGKGNLQQGNMEAVEGLTPSDVGAKGDFIPMDKEA
jgi:hypothetical protein